MTLRHRLDLSTNSRSLWTESKLKAAMKILDAKAAVEQVETCTGLDFKNVTPKPEVVQQAKKTENLFTSHSSCTSAAWNTRSLRTSPKIHRESRTPVQPLPRVRRTCMNFKMFSTLRRDNVEHVVVGMIPGSMAEHPPQRVVLPTSQNRISRGVLDV